LVSGLTAKVNATTCSGKPIVNNRRNLTLVSLTVATASAVTLNVLTADLLPVSVWTNIPILVGVPIQLDNLTVDLTGPDPEYHVSLNNMVGQSANFRRMLLTYLSGEEEMCIGGVLTVPGTTLTPSNSSENVMPQPPVNSTRWNDTVTGVECPAPVVGRRLFALKW
jgi:hypothetical protein